MAGRDRFAKLRELPPPREVYTVWVETNEAAVAFIEAVLLWEDHVANVRREFRGMGGHTWFKLFVTPGHLERVLELLRGLKRFVYIGAVQVESG
ncbi:MAG: hypothetical protein GXO72_04770 [Caldiserica bacterium]|nr:hypothetical protein [Caldisericota bacterium]